MAKKKTTTQAQRAASKSVANKSKTGKDKKAVEAPQEESRFRFPPRVISSLICVGLFLLFLMIFLDHSGALTNLIYKFLLGLFGEVTFYVSIPALLYMFFIQAFSGKRPVIMRSVSLGLFVLICGCISHLLMPTGELSKGVKLLSDLYMGGIRGTTGGLICGSFTMLLQWLCRDFVTMILLVLAAIVALLGAMQITIPSIIRAVQNRPRADWEDDEDQAQEPAAVVVNHIANKRIEHLENKRRIQEQRQQELEQRQKEAAAPKRTRKPKEDELLSQIEQDTDLPVAAAERPVKPSEDDSIFTPVASKPKKMLTEDIPNEMPELDMRTIPEVIPMQMPEIKKPEPEPATQAVPNQKVSAKEAAQSAQEVAKEIAENEAPPKTVYCFPPIDLLKLPDAAGVDGMAEMKENRRRLDETLASFRIDARIINVTRGPSVTRYEVELDKGVRLNKLTTVADDIALSLGASGVRIAAVPGKISVVGIEVPNRAVTKVALREVIDSPAFHKAKSKVSFAVGKDIGDSCIVGNIAKLPHMLIAGTTGSGKSVCMNSIIISLLYKAGPEDVKLIMIDPKMVELGIYNSIPHLLIPVVTDPKKAAGSLQWAVTEMMRRYKAMSDAGVRDLESYNSIMEAEEVEKLPQIVVIIDELADLMIAAAKEVEESICRIAQMGRASGIHLIIATQRPSADIITGLMKANIPSRIAFAVASAMESRIILDTMGAEKLVGKGDMLYSPIGSGKPQRIQGCFVTDAEVEAVASYVKEHYNTSYDQDVIKEIDKKAAQTGSGKSASVADPDPNESELDGDEMLPAAVDVILETQQASVSMLQRRLKLGYARAARIVDEMEEKGIVGPFQGSKPRTILVTKEQWEAMKSGQPQQMDFEDMAEEFQEAVPEEID